jgi:phytoene synthase
LRGAFDALFDIEQTLADIVARSIDPALGAIRMAWWRDALQGLDRANPPHEPRLEAAAKHLIASGETGARLSELADSWLTFFQEDPDVRALSAHGRSLFSIAARLLGATDNDELGSLGGFYGLVAAARLGFPSPLLDYRGGLPPRGPFKREIRPLTALGSLAWRDANQIEKIEPQATPGRAWTLLRHRLTGRIR